MAKKKKKKNVKAQPKKESTYKARQARTMRIAVIVVSLIIVLSMALSSLQIGS